MPKGRLEAFSDGVIAIIITIMVLEMKVPHGTNWEVVQKLGPVALSYVLSFIYVGIYWNNHHHMLHAVKEITGPILWANLHLLFWLSLLPFATGWVGENGFATLPVAFYGGILLMCAIAFFILSHTLLRVEGHDSQLAQALGRDYKSKFSTVLYAVAIPLAFLNRWIAIAIYIGVAVLWFMPDPRIEKTIVHHDNSNETSPENEANS